MFVGPDFPAEDLYVAAWWRPLCSAGPLWRSRLEASYSGDEVEGPVVAANALA